MIGRQNKPKESESLGDDLTGPNGSGSLKINSEDLSQENCVEIINEWLLQRKIRKNKIELLEDLVADMADAMVEGLLVLQDNGKFKYNLIHPLKNNEGEVHINSVELKDRIDYQRGVQPHMTKIKDKDTSGQLLAYACGLSGLHYNELRKLDVVDIGFLRNYAAIFF